VSLRSLPTEWQNNFQHALGDFPVHAICRAGKRPHKTMYVFKINNNRHKILRFIITYEQNNATVVLAVAEKFSKI
jgi:hypothetical protein